VRTALALLAALTTLASVTADAATASRRLKPANDAPRLRVAVGGGTLSIYHVTRRAAPAEYRIQGPTAVRVLSRFLYDGEAPSATHPYEFSVTIDGVELRRLSHDAVVARGSTLEGGGAIGALRRDVVQIPAGTHRVKIAPLDDGTRLALRVFRGDGRASTTTWIPYAPESYVRPLILQGRDSETTYYRFTTEQPAVLELAGPLRLRVRSRLDFGHRRGRHQTYVIKVFVDGDLVQSWPLETRASHISTYPDLPEITPGVARDLELELGRGRHQIEIALDCTTARAACLRVLIPERAVTNGT
jgi:hypothetical protein